MLMLCKKNFQYYNDVEKINYLLLKGNYYECLEFLSFKKVKDNNNWYIFNSDEFYNYFYSEKELIKIIRRNKLDKIYESR